MKNVVIIGWEKGFQKISMTKLIRAYTGYDLARGKHCVDDMLEGKIVVLPRISPPQAKSFIAEAAALGAICHLEEISEVALPV